MLKILWCLEVVTCVALGQRETLQLRYAVEEESFKDTFVGDIIADSKVIPELEMTMHSADGRADRLLRLDRKTGRIFTAVVIDRESICSRQDRPCLIEAAVQISLGRWINVFVEVKDVNDHAPIFPRDSYQYTLSEKVEVGYQIRLELAHDPDYGINADISYELLKVSEVYVLKVDGDKGLVLVVNCSLDYETEGLRKTSLRVVACDGGLPRKCNSMGISIILTDVNDNEPHFDRSEYEVQIPETTTINSIVFTFSATDADSGDNGRIRYSIMSSSDPVGRAHFNVYDDGRLRVIRSLEDIDSEELQLRVLVEDLGAPSLRSSCLMRIKVIDVNNHRPDIRINFPVGMVLMENLPAGTFMALITVTDEDRGVHGATRCDVKDSRGVFFIRHENKMGRRSFYNLLTTRVVDREIEAKVEVNVTCHDGGAPALSSLQIFTVEVGDENEYQPVFDRGPLKVVIPEDTEISTTVFRLVATDRDASSNLTYRLMGGSQDFFVNPRSGAIIVKSRLDRETFQVHRLRCRVLDNIGKRVLSSNTVVTVTVSDVNDNTPRLIAPKTLKVLENSPGKSMTLLGQLKAIDEDLGENGTITYSILAVEVATDGRARDPLIKNVFRLEETSGRLYLEGSLDREEVSKYRLTVGLSDRGSPPLHSNWDLEVEVMDMNDHRPRLNLTYSQYNFSSPPKVGLPILRLTAFDPDDQVNANLTFTLLSGSQFFNLDLLTGQLYASRILREGAFDLTYQACDNGHPPSYSEVGHLRIRVGPSVTSDFGKRERNEIDSLLVTVISASACVVFLCLLSAIAVVLWQRILGKTDRTSKSSGPDSGSQAAKMWTDQPQEDNLALDNRSFMPNSVMSQRMGSDGCDNVMDDGNMCSMFHLRYPFGQELEISSADSGKGTIDEENLALDLKGRHMPLEQILWSSCRLSTTTRHSSPVDNNHLRLQNTLFNEQRQIEPNHYQGRNHDPLQTWRHS